MEEEKANCLFKARAQATSVVAQCPGSQQFLIIISGVKGAILTGPKDAIKADVRAYWLLEEVRT